jgi:hypothetical protein
MRRPCLDCGKIVNGTRCATCATAHFRRLEQGRPSSTARGYGVDHRRARAELVKQLPVPCHGCGQILATAKDMVAAHRVDGHPEFGWLASCRSCNERMKQRR